MSFQAKFVGICKCGCGQTIRRGDWINYTMDGLVVHEGHEHNAQVNKDNPVCPKCYLTHAGDCF